MRRPPSARRTAPRIATTVAPRLRVRLGVPRLRGRGRRDAPARAPHRQQRLRLRADARRLPRLPRARRGARACVRATNTATRRSRSASASPRPRSRSRCRSGTSSRASSLFAGKYVDGFGRARALPRARRVRRSSPLPTVFMGTTFPLLLGRIAARPDVAARVGRLTVANTLGTIARLDRHRLLRPACARLAARARRDRRRASPRRSRCSPRARSTRSEAFAAPRPSRSPAVALLALVAAPRWDLARLTNGANVYFTAGPPPDRIEFVREDVHGGVTTVARRGDVTHAVHERQVPGRRRRARWPRSAASRTSRRSSSTHERALVIGLGTGTTLGTIAAYPWKRIDVAEISPAIVEASRRYFSGPTR